MPVQQAIAFATGKLPLESSPIKPDWVLEGNPMARNKLIAGRAGGSHSTLMCDCTVGRFNWYYDIGETICVVEGTVTVRDPAGSTRTLSAGDTAFFPAGSS